MEFVEYKIKKGDTLESIAKEYDITVKELVVFHNQHFGITQQIIGDSIPFHIKKMYIPIITIEIKSEGEEIYYNKKNLAKYRCEQTVITKLNGIPTNTADIKREFDIKKNYENGSLLVEVNIKDNFVIVNPNQYQEAINLVADLDLVKCNNIILKIDSETGKIIGISNHQTIINYWFKYKEELHQKTSFIRNHKAAEAMRKFIDMAEQQISNEKTLIDDLNSKMFFDVFFDKYLVNAPDKLQPYKRKFYSQLFLGEVIDLNITQTLLQESEEQIIVRKVSDFDKELRNSKGMEQQYNEKYKSTLHYKFSEYNASYRERVLYNENSGWLEEGEVSIIEEVKNNIQILVSYNIKKIE